MIISYRNFRLCTILWFLESIQVGLLTRTQIGLSDNVCILDKSLKEKGLSYLVNILEVLTKLTGTESLVFVYDDENATVGKYY